MKKFRDFVDQLQEKDKGEYDYEGSMAKTQLRTMIDAAQALHDMLEDDENMPEWVQGKITKATDYIDTARDYMKSQANESIDEASGTTCGCDETCKHCGGQHSESEIGKTCDCCGNTIQATMGEGSETWEAGYKRRVVKTTKPEHKEKGHNWRIKGKDRPEISIKLYKEKPSQAEFNKQMKRVAGHEFGG